MIQEIDLPKECGLHTIIVPSIFPTGDTRCYLGEGDDGWTVVDTGVSTAEAKEIWDLELKRIGITYKQIKKIFLTHNHPDHNGLSGWVQQKTDAEVYMSKADIVSLDKYSLPQEQHLKALRQDMEPYGIPLELISSFVKDIEIIKQFFIPYAELKALEPGQTFRMGDDRYGFLPTPGHSDGHVMYMGIEHRRILSGDSLLADRVSQISDWPYSKLDNPLAIQLEALREVGNNGPGVVLTSHGPIFKGVPARLPEIEKQHQKRLDKVVRMLQKNMTLPELCQAINVKARVLQEMRVSWADTRAYLEFLWRQGKISKREDEFIMYGPVA